MQIIKLLAYVVEDAKETVYFLSKFDENSYKKAPHPIDPSAYIDKSIVICNTSLERLSAQYLNIRKMNRGKATKILFTPIVDDLYDLNKTGSVDEILRNRPFSNIEKRKFFEGIFLNK